MTEEVDEPIDFPDRWLRPLTATMKRTRGPQADCATGSRSWDIEIPLEPFDLEELLEEGEPDLGETSFRLDRMCLPGELGQELVGQTFRFPANPVPGYVDGSIYLQYVHNPADLLEVRFGTIARDEIAATFVIAIRFEFEMSGFRDRRAVISTMVRLPKELGGSGSMN